jgi:hypothetical protein
MAAHLSGRRLRRRLSGSGWDRTCWALMRPGAVQTPQSQLTDSVPDSAGQCTAESSDQRRLFTSAGGCGVSYIITIVPTSKGRAATPIYLRSRSAVTPAATPAPNSRVGSTGLRHRNGMQSGDSDDLLDSPHG